MINIQLLIYAIVYSCGLINKYLVYVIASWNRASKVFGIS